MNNFLFKPYDGGGALFVMPMHSIFQQKFWWKLFAMELKERFAVICCSHHISLVKLLNASVSRDDYIYLVYEFVNGANLSDCLRNHLLNPNFTIPISAAAAVAPIVASISAGLLERGASVILIVGMVKSKLKGHSKRITSLAFFNVLSVLVSSKAGAQICVWNSDGWEKQKTRFLQLPIGMAAARSEFH